MKSEKEQLEKAALKNPEINNLIKLINSNGDCSNKHMPSIKIGFIKLSSGESDEQMNLESIAVHAHVSCEKCGYNFKFSNSYNMNS